MKRAIDNQCFAGGFTLGAAQAGFEVIAKQEQKGAFGMPNVKENEEHITLNGIDYQVEEDNWEGYDDVTYFFGNPPCSGFSMMNTAAQIAKKYGRTATHTRGADSPINDCMWAFIEGASRSRGPDGKQGPPYIAFESVQGAGKKAGRELMRKLRDDLESRTGQRYDLTHVFMNAAHCGGAQARRRYFALFHREPFEGVNVTRVYVPNVHDVIGDLQGLDYTTWDAQTPVYAPSIWALGEVVDQPFIDAHIADTESRRALRMMQLMQGVDWLPKETEEPVAIKYYEKHGCAPPAYGDDFDPYTKKWGFYQTRRLRWEQLMYVMAGNGLRAFIHPKEDRHLTIREGSRLMGYPDSWKWTASETPARAQSWLGKGLAVQAGRWMSSQVMNAINGGDVEYKTAPEPDDEVGLVDREYVVNTTNLHKAWWKEEHPGA